MATDARGWVSTLRDSHDRLAGIVGSLSPGQVSGPSYCSEWSVAQVLSHLGSGAEIGLANLEAMLAAQPPPSREIYQRIWDQWNAKPPARMAADALVSDESHVSRFEGLSDHQLAGLSTSFMGRTLDAAGIVGMRLAEHAVHTWDVEVTLDPEATVQPGAVDLVVDLLPSRMGRLARGDKPGASPVELLVETVSPARSYSLSVGDEVTLGPDAEGADAGGAKGRVALSAEALLRLAYGRLDPDHTPADVAVDGPVSLEELRVLFPGF
jgi:uncharacterized protein (TIGR03083 family)